MLNDTSGGQSAEQAYAYTPGLKVKKEEVVSKARLLPLPGDVLVKVSDTTDFETVVAQTEVPGKPAIIDTSTALNLEPEDLMPFIVKKAGDRVDQDDIIAKYTPFFGLVKKYARSPIQGVIESISEFTGHVVVREPPTLVKVRAYIPGKIKEVMPNRGVIIEQKAALIQGIFGIGGERHGMLSLAVDNPQDLLTPERILPEHKGRIVVGGSQITLEAFRKAVEVGVCGVIAGGMRGVDLKACLGYQIGVAITGQEEIGITLILTEGFGKMNMSSRTFSLLKEFNGYDAAINGTTQIRAGVIRPEIIIPHEKHESKDEAERNLRGMTAGTPVRIIGPPYFGEIGTVVSLPVQLEEVETESSVRVVEVQIEGRKVSVPRANVEIIEE